MPRKRLLTDSQIEQLNEELREKSTRNGRVLPGRVIEWAEAFGINVRTMRGYVRKAKSQNKLTGEALANELKAITAAQNEPATMVPVDAISPSIAAHSANHEP